MKNRLIFAFIIVGVNLLNYFSIREIIWSIYWLKKGGKFRKLKTISKKETIISRIKMSYLRSLISPYEKEFDFWEFIKSFFVILESILLLLYLIISLNQNAISVTVLTVFDVIVISQSFIWLVAVRIQFGVGGHLTKYDEKRIKKKNKRSH